MTEEHQQLLSEMAQRYGDYSLLNALTENAEEACRTDYADNDEAVIHRDLVSLQAVLARAKSPVSSVRVTEEDKKALATMTRWSGTYKVVKALAKDAKKASRTNDTGTEDAVTRRDTVMLDAAVERMNGNHFLRAFESA